MNTNPADLAREVVQPAQDDSTPPMVQKVKETLDMASNSQSGTEPVSGEMGEGTAEQPFDQGNKEGEFVLFGDVTGNGWKGRG